MGVFWRREAQEAVGEFRLDRHLSMDYDYWLRLGLARAGQVASSTSTSPRSGGIPPRRRVDARRKMLREQAAVAREHAGESCDR